MKFVGIDASLRKTGVAIVENSRLIFSTTINPSDKLRGIARLRHNRDALLEVLTVHGVQTACVEGYAYSARASNAHSTGEWGGVLRVALAEAGITLHELTPGGLKKFATGKGNAAGKAPIVMAVYKMLKVDLSHAEDEADAVILALALEAKYGVSRLKVTKSHLDAVGKMVLLTPAARTRRR